MLNKIYQTITIEHIEKFRYIKYIVISKNPEEDAFAYISKYANEKNIENLTAIGWDYPHLAEYQVNEGLRGYVAAGILPKDFKESEAILQDEASYAVLTIKDPFAQPVDCIPNAYQEILRYMEENQIIRRTSENCLPCFEHIFEEEGIIYMNIYICVNQ